MAWQSLFYFNHTYSKQFSSQVNTFLAHQQVMGQFTMAIFTVP